MTVIKWAAIAGEIAEIQESGGVRELVIKRKDCDGYYEASRNRCPVPRGLALTATSQLKHSAGRDEIVRLATEQ